MSPAESLAAIAQDIEALKPEFPQLAGFSADRHFQKAGLVISYEFHTHRATHRGGWTSGVPNPDDDGIWFHVDLHEADSMAQIHTQPVTRRLDLGDQRVMFLILEGAKTNPVAGRIHAILAAHGVKGA